MYSSHVLHMYMHTWMTCGDYYRMHMWRFLRVLYLAKDKPESILIIWTILKPLLFWTKILLSELKLHPMEITLCLLHELTSLTT